MLSNTTMNDSTSQERNQLKSRVDRVKAAIEQAKIDYNNTRSNVPAETSPKRVIPTDTKMNPDDTFTMLPNPIFEKGKYLTVKAKWVYTSLMSFRNTITNETFPSVPTIGEKAGYGPTATHEALTELEFFGWISRTRRKTEKGGNTSNDYEFRIPTTLSPTQAQAKQFKSSNLDPSPHVRSTPHRRSADTQSARPVTNYTTQLNEMN